MKNDSLALEKLSSVVIALLAHFLILLETNVGNNIGSKNINSKIEPRKIPEILRVLKKIFFIVKISFD